MSNSNKAIVAVLAVLAVVLIALIAASGSCSRSGGGSATGGVASGGETASGGGAVASGGYAGLNASGLPDDASYEELRDALLAELDATSYPEGANGRDAVSGSHSPTSADVYEQAADRGFGDYAIMADYNESGEYVGATEVDSGSQAALPSYTVPYVSATGVVWYVYVNDGVYEAVPLAAEGLEPTGTTILMEGDHLVQYDGLTKRFSDFAPADLPDATVIPVNRIDAATLDGFTPAALGMV